MNPAARLPRNFKRWAMLIVQLLHKGHITASGSGEKLLKIIKNPINRHLPAGSVKIGFAPDGDLVHPIAFANSLDLVRLSVLKLNFL